MYRASTTLRLFLFVLLAALLGAVAPPVAAQPSFTKVFTPDTIGPGSVSILRFEIVNGGGAVVSDLAFTDTLPAAVTLATPANGTTTCVDAVLTAPDGGGTITFSDGSVGAFGTCFVEVSVTSSTVGTHTNTTGDLTSDAGNSGTATDDLMVVTNRPGFSKSFSPTSVGLGGRSTLTFTIDNTANPGFATSVGFTDNLPAGMVVAAPSNATTDCTGSVLTASSGGSLITLGGAGFLLAGATCTATVDVIGAAAGNHVNLSGELTSTSGGPLVSSGRATAALEVTTSTLSLVKGFTDDPVNPGGTVTLEFTLTNLDRDFDATNVAFTDDLDTVLSGLVATGLPMSDVCGTGSSLTGTSLLSLTGGSLPLNGGSCTFSVTLQVPAGATAGAYPNLTSSVTADIDGSPVVGDPATETLFVNDAPLLTKTFLTNPVGAGDTVSLEFTITNTSSTSSATNITFNDNLSAFISGATPAALPAAGSCGAGSVFFTTFIGGELNLGVLGGTLAPSASCTFTVDLLIPAGTPTGSYLNTTTDISATVDGTTQTGQSASDTLSVAGPPRLEKVFTDDPVAPGDTVTLEFTISHDLGAPGDATAIAFTDDLTATLAGLTAVGLPMNDICGTGSTLSGTTNLSFTGGTLTPGSSCTFSVTLQVPAAAPPGSFLNQTSMLMSTVSGVPVIGGGASDVLDITGLMLTKSFTDDPVLPGGLVTLEFTIENSSPTLDATGIFFTDNLGGVIPGLVAEAPLPATPCGAGSSISGTSFLIFVGGDVPAGTSCTFSVNVRVPAGAADGDYPNVTSSLTATFGGTTLALPPAQDVLTVFSDLLLFTKSFTDDPVAPGGTVTLEFTLSNTDATETITGITFTDDLDAALSGLAAVGLPMMNVCGAGSTISGTSLLTLTGGSLAPGASCTFSVTLNVPAAVSLGTVATNTTSSATGTAAGVAVNGPPATDDLEINFLTFSKSFDGPTTAGGTAVLTFSVANLSTTATVSGIGFTDDLDAVLSGLVATGLPMNDVCGTGSTLAGTSFLTLTGGNLLPGGSCTFMVTVQVPAAATAGTFPNTTSDLTLNGLVAADPATADLTIEPPPTFAKLFVPDSIGLGQSSTLLLTIDNTASSLAATNLDFTDNLPAGLVVATPANAVTNCTGGTVTAVSGSGVVAYTGGSVGAAATCTVQADVTAGATGSLVNTTGDLTSSSGNSGTATDTLTVNAPPSFAKAFAPDAIAIAGVSTLTLTIDNTSSTVVTTSLDFTDNLPAAVVVATPANVVNSCTGGTVTATSGSGTVSYTGGSVAAGASCTVQVDVTSSTVGAHVNLTGDLTSSLGNSGTATDTLVVNPAPGFAKAFAPNPIIVGGVSTLTLTIDNTGSTLAATALDFTDIFPLAMVVAFPTNASTTCTGGTVTAVAGAPSIAYTGGSVAAGATCTVQADVTSSAVGAQVNITGDLTSSLGNSGTATDTLTVDFASLGFAKAFSPTVIQVGEVSTLTLTIDNTSNPAAVGNVAFNDPLPAGVVVATPANSVTTCTGGTITAVAGSGTVSYSGGTAPASATCTVSVDVTSTAAGSLVNTTGNLTSDAGTTAPASATLTVISDAVFTKSFLASPVLPAGFVGLEYTITNTSAAASLANMSFTDDFNSVIPGLVAVGLPAADVCGAGSSITGTGSVSFTGGNLPASGSCTFAITLQVPANASEGVFISTSSLLTFSGTPTVGASSTAGPAVDDLAVAFFSFEKFFSPQPATSGTVVTLTFMLSNPDPVNSAAGLTFTDDLDAVIQGMEAVGLPLSDVCGVGSQVSGTSVITLADGLLGPGGSCSFDVEVQLPQATGTGSFVNTTSVLSATVNSLPVVGGPASVAMAMLEVQGLAIEIPTLGTWGLILLIGLLMLAATRLLRTRSSAR